MPPPPPQRCTFLPHLRRVLTALDDVLGSQESPLDVKEPLALDFLPSTLIQELRVVKTGETLATHPFYSLLMDDAGSAHSEASSPCSMSCRELPLAEDRVDFGGRLAAAFRQKAFSSCPLILRSKSLQCGTAV